MIHEFKEIIQQAGINQQKGLKNVLASVVCLEGSSYRKPGVRMLISESLHFVGAVSGGCVEKEIIHRSKEVFSTGKAKIITYDGRYRLGCEGILYILIEPFFVSDTFFKIFADALSNRESIEIVSSFLKEDEVFGNFGTFVKFQNNQQCIFSKNFYPNLKNEEPLKFSQKLKPAFKLIIIGGEHDAVKLCATAFQLGWEVHVVTSVKESKTLQDFPGANKVFSQSPEMMQFKDIDTNCAIVIMNHSYVQDLKYLIALSKFSPKYIGVLGAPTRRERLFHELLEFQPTLPEDFFDIVYTPAGLHIGAETPEEIAISIVAEILSVIRKKTPFSLRKIEGKIHN